MMQYKAVSSTSIYALVEEVSALLNKGWKLHGELKIIVHHLMPEFYQVLTKGNPDA